MADVTLRSYRPDDAPWLVERHAMLYAEAEGFDETFGPLVAGILADFDAGHDPARERGWIAESAGTRLGSVFCVAAGDETAKLRLFLLVPEARGQGVGKRLLEACTSFARAAGYRDMTLWTHESHRAACALYRKTGWALTESYPVRSFGVDLVEQKWALRL